jgi:hypothetical protein
LTSSGFTPYTIYMDEATNTYRILGTTADIDTCYRCGKQGLKKTVILSTSEGAITYYGTDCAARTIRGNNKASSKKAITKDADVIERIQKFLTAGHDAKKICNFISGRYGYGTEPRNGGIRVLLSTGDSIVTAEGVAVYA